LEGIEYKRLSATYQAILAEGKSIGESLEKPGEKRRESRESKSFCGFGALFLGGNPVHRDPAGRVLASKSLERLEVRVIRLALEGFQLGERCWGLEAVTMSGYIPR